MTFRLIVTIEHIVDHKIETRAQIRHIATESLVGINRDFETVQIHAIVRGKELLNISVLISFDLLRWKALLAKNLESLIAHSVHRLWSMRENHLPCLLV